MIEAKEPTFFFFKSGLKSVIWFKLNVLRNISGHRNWEIFQEQNLHVSVSQLIIVAAVGKVVKDLGC